MAKKPKPVTSGDLFSIPLPSTTLMGVGQVLSEEPECLNSVLCAFFSDLLEADADVAGYKPQLGKLLSVQLTSRDLLDSGRWRVLGHTDPFNVTGIYPIHELREKEYVGAKVRGSRAMWELISAFNRQSAWDDFNDPNYLDALLAPGILRPANVILKKGDR